MVTCKCCGADKPLSEYYANNRTKSGYSLSKCKECAKKATKANRTKRAEYYRAYDRIRGNRQSPQYQQEYRKRNPEKRKAQYALFAAVRDNRVQKLDACEHCGSPDSLHGHHTSYARDMWLCVTWLCAACHRQVHA
jgi:hypothetical protein